MLSDNQSDIDKKYFRIREVAEMLDVPLSTLRFWEKEFPEVQPERTATNRRLYTPHQIERLRALHYLLKVKGLKIEAARAQLHRNPETITRQQQIMEGLVQVRNELKNLLASLEKRR